MSATLVTELSDQIQKFWSPLLVPELKESAILPSLVSTDYDGQISQGGDTVYVSMIQAANGSRKQISSTGEHTVIESEKLKTQRVGIIADQIFSASFELENLVDLQTQLADPAAKQSIRNALMKGVELKINDYLYSLVAPSTSAPDHSVASVSDFNFAALMANRLLASTAKWPDEDRFLLLDPSFMNDFLTDTKNTSSDYVGDAPLIGGKKPYYRSGFWIMEDNSSAMNQLSPSLAAADYSLAFHKSFMYLVMQQQATFKLSDLHANKQRGYLLTVDLIGGAKLGLQGNVKHIVNYNS